MLRRLWLAAAVATGVTLLGAVPAAAESTVVLNRGNILAGGTLAARVGQGCEVGGGPYTDRDVWVFILPGTHSATGDFVSVTLSMDTDGDSRGDVAKNIPDDGGGFVNGGSQAAKAYIALPAGWRLMDATAQITGTADKLNLTHACAAAAASPSATPSVSASASAVPFGSASPSVSASASKT